MKSVKFFSFLSGIFLVLAGTSGYSQTGMVSGKILDKASGETIIGAVVEVYKGDAVVKGVSSDFDGNYNIQLDPGTYDLVFKYISYAPYKVADVILAAKENQTIDVALETESQQLTEIVVKADVVRSSEVALIALQRRASSIQDGVSAQQISRTGSSNAADAIRQLPGAVVEGGRFIVVRGLGDRYSLSQLNGLTLPGTDPYRNSSSMDLIPSRMIDNIISIKTFTPDLPGNFSGGLVNIETKSIPDRFNLSVSVNGSYNSQSTFQNEFLTSTAKGKWDWLGFEDGSRNQPDLLLNADNRSLLSSSTYLQARQPKNEDVRNIFHESSRQLSNSFIPVSETTPLNTGFNFSLGNRFKLFNHDMGFMAAINYGSHYNYYGDGKISTFINTNTDFLFAYQDLTERKSVYNPSLGALLNLAYRPGENHIITASGIFNNDAEVITRQQSGSFLGQVSNSLAEFNTLSTEFIQRQVTQLRLGGKHALPGLNHVQVDWNIARTISFQREPDLKYFAYTKVCEDNGSGEINCQYYINNAEIAFPYHFFRDLNDKALEGKLDITIPFANKWDGNQSNSIKVGGMLSDMNREFSEYRYQLNNSGVPSSLNFTNFDGDFNSFFDPSNFGIIDTTFLPSGEVQRYVTGYHYINQINARNFYTGHNQIAAAYVMATVNILRKLKVIGGVRLEVTDIQVVSQDPTVPVGQIKQNDFLPSLNLIYALNERNNIRAAATRTLARPNMRELAPFVQFDTKNGFFNVGNPNLKRTQITNFDVRYENYPKPGELFAIGGYVKSFQDPIIRAFNPKASIPELSFINVDKASVYGVELEIRKELSFLTPALKRFYLNTNLALIQSEYKIPQEEIDNAKNIDPEYDQTTRPFQGQSPYIVNTILSYVNPDQGWEVALAYNVSGQKLYNISLFATPDVYEKPVSLLNIKVAKRLTPDFQLSVTGQNLLNARNQKVLHFNGQDYVAESYTIGRTFGLSLTYQVR